MCYTASGNTYKGITKGKRISSQSEGKVSEVELYVNQQIGSRSGEPHPLGAIQAELGTTSQTVPLYSGTVQMGFLLWLELTSRSLLPKLQCIR